MKTEQIAQLERRHKALESEISEALRHSPANDLMIVDLRRRELYLKEEIERGLRAERFGALH